MRADRFESDEPHNLADAIVGGARVLCLADSSLSADFKAEKFVDKPRGSVYRRAKYVHSSPKFCGMQGARSVRSRTVD